MFLVFYFQNSKFNVECLILYKYKKMQLDIILNNFIFPLILGIFLSAIFTFFIIKIANKFNILDIPRDRHQHKAPTPLLGGIAVGSAFIISTIFFILINYLPGEYISLKKILGILIGVSILMIGGFLDDKFNFKPTQNILFQILAVLVVIGFGVGVNFITNPFSHGDVFRIDNLKYGFFLFGMPFVINLVADTFTFLWLLGTTYTTKVLDGVDGLVSGISGIGFLIIGFLCLNNVVHQPDTALIAFLIAGSYFGFLIFNFNPAKIFLGESGATISGFLLGSLAIISGGKIAITLLILSVPIIDFLIVIISRILSGKSPFKGDRRHLHYRLKNIGLNDKQIVLVMYSITIAFGSIGLISNSLLKFWSIIAAFCFMIIGLFVTGYIRKKMKAKELINQ